MAVLTSTINDRYALYNGDCIEVLSDFPNASFDLSIYSPPFGGLYHYSSDDRDLANCKDYAAFLEHYEFVVSEVARTTKPGSMTVVHVMDPMLEGKLVDLQGDVIRMHERHGFEFYDRKMVWKDPLKEAFRTRALALRHNQLLKDSTPCRSALPDYIVVMQKKGTRKVPIAHPEGLLNYAGELRPDKRRLMGYTEMPEHLLETGTGWKGNTNDNPLSHWIFRRYASPLWDDVRQSRVLPYREARETEEEKHPHPLQLDVIERALTLWSNPGETILTPFAGVGSEVYGAVQAGRRAVGIDLKTSYYRQMEKNLLTVDVPLAEQTLDLFDDEERMAAA
jgi:DNA modification methylase